MADFACMGMKNLFGVKSKKVELLRLIKSDIYDSKVFADLLQSKYMERTVNVSFVGLLRPQTMQSGDKVHR